MITISFKLEMKWGLLGEVLCERDTSVPLNALECAAEGDSLAAREVRFPQSTRK